MIDIGRFLVNHWEIVLGAFLSLLSLIIALIRKKPVADALTPLVDAYACWHLANAMQTAEDKFKDGKTKKEYVTQQCVEWIKKQCTLDAHSEELVRRSIGLLIEAALSCPERSK